MGFNLPLPASEERSKYKTRTDKHMKSRPGEKEKQKWFRKAPSSTETLPLLLCLVPCYRPTHLGTHQQTELGDPNPDGHSIGARSRSAPDNRMSSFCHTVSLHPFIHAAGMPAGECGRRAGSKSQPL